MKARTFVMFLLLGWLILILQSTVVSYTTYGVFQPELLLVILLHGGVYRRGVDGVVLALSYGYLMDLFSGRPFGTYLFIYITLFFLARLLSEHLLLQTRLTQMGLIFVFTLLGELILFGLTKLTAVPQGVSLEFSVMLARSASNSIGVLVLFPFLSGIENRIWTKPQTLRYG